MMRGRQNVCVEKTLEKAFQVVLHRDVVFDESKTSNDTQIDIGPVFMQFDAASSVWTSGHSAETLAHDFAQSDKEKAYFMRSGVGGGAGHYQLLYFDGEGWRGYSTETNQNRYTNADGTLSEAGRGLLTTSATAVWGLGRGQYSIAIQEASAARVMAAANFVHDYRMQRAVLGAQEREEIAIENLFTEPNFASVLKTGDGFIAERADKRSALKEMEDDFVFTRADFYAAVNKKERVLTSYLPESANRFLQAVHQKGEANPDGARALYTDILTELYLLKESPDTSSLAHRSIDAISAEVNTLLEGLDTKPAARR